MTDGTPRSLPHIYLQGHGTPQEYTAYGSGSGEQKLPERDRVQHAEQLTNALKEAVKAGEDLLKRRDKGLSGGIPGFYLEFQLSAAQSGIVDKLEKRGGRFPIEVVNVRPSEPGSGTVAATVFVPEKQRDYYLKKIEAYRTQDRLRVVETENGPTSTIVGPKNEVLVASVDTVRLAVARSLYTDAPDLFPAPGVSAWWEVWLRQGTRQTFENAAAHLGLPLRQHSLRFPEREVLLVGATPEAIGHIIANTDAIAELRLARDTPADFLNMSGAEQRLWSSDLADRVIEADSNAPAVCLLDSGSTIRHPLIARGLTANDHQAYSATWSPEDLSRQSHGGHGTEMSGIALYGDLTDILSGSGAVPLTHRLESVKILPDRGANDPDLYGAITAQAIARAEISAPLRPRTICLAITSKGDHWRGRPSSWSAEIDTLAFGTDDVPRLVVVSAGNIAEPLEHTNYLDINDTSPIESPAQAWNALTVGAFSEKVTIADSTYAGWKVLGGLGDLMPRSRTSVSWGWEWPIKPDVVFEGGNLGIDPATGHGDNVDDLALLTTFRAPEQRAFTTTGDTSAATALAARMGAMIQAAKPTLWPETVRGLIVHSAEWTPAMTAHLGTIDRNVLLRRYGFGVPSIVRALGSLQNDVTLVIEDTITPFTANGSKIDTKDMMLHDLPWPKEELLSLGGATVQLRITLSYFIEPNPGERGRSKRHTYASHGLRFALKRGDERLDVFCRRINAAAGTRPSRKPSDTGWIIGPKLRNRGSLHADIWEGTAAELSERDAIAIYPTGGWWRENPGQQRADRKVRYSLVASVRVAQDIDLYTPIHTTISPEVEVGV